MNLRMLNQNIKRTKVNDNMKKTMVFSMLRNAQPYVKAYGFHKIFLTLKINYINSLLEFKLKILGDI